MKFLTKLRVQKVVGKLNKELGHLGHFNYEYYKHQDWHDITHDVNDLIQQDDEFAMRVAEILMDLNKKGIYNYSFYEWEK